MKNPDLSAARRPVGWLGFLALVVFGLIRLVSLLLPDPQNERVARGLVESGYQTACGSAAGEQCDHRDWEKIERRYGRVRSWHVLGRRRPFPGHGWEFDVEATRERAVTQERIEADAGPSKLYGYYSSLSNLRVVSARP